MRLFLWKSVSIPILMEDIRASALIIAVCLLFSSCSNTAGSSLNIPSSEIISPEALDNKFHTFSSSSKSVKSDFLSLDFDETSYSLSVTDLNSDFTWYSLPQSPDSGAFTAGVTLYSPKGIYSLNSQDNSVGFGTASYEVKDNTIIQAAEIKKMFPGVLTPGKTSVQVIVGPKVQFLADEFKKVAKK